jgi:hypothetical protein
MVGSPPTVLDEPVVRAALEQAWEDSQPGPKGGHEEGGFILRDTTGSLGVERWPPGEHNAIVVPPHPRCKVSDGDILATFHTHPNTGPDFLQEPSDTDIRAVCDDPNLKGKFYEGEFVISQDKTYRIAPTGRVIEVGVTEHIFAHGGR